MSRFIYHKIHINKKPFPTAIFLVVAFLLLIFVFLFNASGVCSLESCLTTCTRNAPEGTNEFRVINLNMLHGYPDFDYLTERIDYIAEQINFISPDFVIMQEVPWTWSTRSTARYFAEKTGMNYAYLSANGNRWTILFAEGEAILSKYPLKDVEFLELKPRAGFFEHRVALKVTAAAPWGDIQLVSTHLTDGDTDVNKSQLHNLYQFVSSIGGGNVIVAGDFNARESSNQIQFIINKWIDTYRLANPADQGFTCCVDHLSGSALNDN